MGITFLSLLYLAIGGVVGVYARFGITLLVHNVFGQKVPIATLIINLAGSFLLAFLFVLAQTSGKFALPPQVRLGLFTGVFGAFTTFSTFILEAVTLMEHGENVKAALYIAISVGGGLLLGFAGVFLARQFV